MPQLRKGGKFIFGWSLIRPDATIKLPDSAVNEYKIASEGKVILISGSRKTGGFCVSRRKLLANSEIGEVLREIPQLDSYAVPEGSFAKWKGRLYCWLAISTEGTIRLTDEIFQGLSIKKGDRLLCIRGSDIAFVMGAKGPLVELASSSKSQIDVY